MNSEGLAFYVQFIKRDASLGRFLSLVQFHPTWIARGSLVAARGDEPARSQNAIFSAQKDSCQCRFAISVRCAGANSSSVASTENELPTGVVSELQRECLLTISASTSCKIATAIQELVARRNHYCRFAFQATLTCTQWRPRHGAPHDLCFNKS